MCLMFVTGGARSGKSTQALRLAGRAAERRGGEVWFVATAEAGDDEMSERIARHRRERPPQWHTVEEPHDVVDVVRRAPTGSVLVLDCLSLWVSNLMGRGEDEETVLARARELTEACTRHDGDVVVVTNEVGSGLVPMEALGRAYRDVLGRVNAVVAKPADPAVLVVAGRTLILDPEGALS